MSQLAQIQAVSSAWRRSSDEEALNTATHGFGFLMSLGGAALITAALAASRDTWLVLGCEAYVASLVAVYATSTLSHYANSVRWKGTFRRLDQAFIYLLIVGTYTPFSIAYLHGAQWWWMLGVMWGVALVGFVSKLFFAYRVDTVSLVSYVVLGWLPIVSLPTLWQTAPQRAFESVIAGGLCYSVGIWFLMNDERVPRFHAAWHLCVIAGSVCHFLGIYLFVVCGRS